MRATGVFAFRDAFALWQHLLLPARFGARSNQAALQQEARIEKVSEGVHKVTVLQHNIHFYWLGRVDGNLHFSIAVEFDPEFPHYYTTPPIQLASNSLILDVGACEGLFAFRTLKQGLAARAICFEPSSRTAEFLKAGAELNRVGDRITVEVAAVSNESGTVYFEEGDSPEANRVVSIPSDRGATRIRAITLDNYCATNRLKLGPRDMIKIDAEGADLDILRGAERMIKVGAPQIAVTTYHKEQHAREILSYLQSIQPRYRFRLKGLIVFGQARFWGGAKPRPVLLQAAAPD